MGGPDVLACAVHEVKLATVVIHDLGDYWVTPQAIYGQGKVVGKAEVRIDGGEVQLIACNLLCGYLWRWQFCQLVYAMGRGSDIRGFEPPQAQEIAYALLRRWPARFPTGSGRLGPDKPYAPQLRNPPGV